MARALALGALGLAVIAVVAVLLISGGSSYHVRLLFSDASGLVSGDQVMIGPSNVGSVDSVSLTRDGAAAIVVSLQPDAAPLYRGTVARIAENGLAGIASHYVTLEPATDSNPTIPDGGTITEQYTHAEVSLDQVFDTLDPLTRAGIRNLIRGEATSISGRAKAANQTLHYLAPALASTSSVTKELSRYEPAFDQLLVSGAQTMKTLASRTQQLTDLVRQTDTATGAIAAQSSALEQTLALLPNALSRSTSTFAGLRSTLNTLKPTVAVAKPALRNLAPFAAALRKLATTSIPTVADLAGIVTNTRGTGDLTTLLKIAPGLERAARSAFPSIITSLNNSAGQVTYLREYTPDVIAALANVGQAAGYYDGNGHYLRTQPFFGAFGLDTSTNQLVPLASGQTRYSQLTVTLNRCPGSAVQRPPDGSAPWQIDNSPSTTCDAAAVPPGP